MIKKEPESRCFRMPKSSSQESDLVNEAVSVSIKYKTIVGLCTSSGLRLRWTFQGLRTTQGSSLECRHCGNGCSVAELLAVQIRFK